MPLIPFVLPVAVGAGIYLLRKQREYAWGWVSSNSSLKGKLYIITGANTGLGYETAKHLVNRGAIVIMACRNEEKCKEAIKKIREFTKEGEMIFLELDLASFESIRKFAKQIQDEYPVFDCLINNAGLAVQEKQLTKENFELHCGVNHLGHFLLTNLLMDNIRANKSRIVVVSSKMHERAKVDLNLLGKFVEKKPGEKTNNMYNNSKLMNFYFAKELYKKGLDVHVLCPGLCHTDFFRSYEPKFYHYILFSPVILFFLRSAVQGAQNIIFAATENVNTETENPSKSYLVLNLQQTKSKIDLSDELSEQLWKKSAELCGL
ncbi:unnamed protein product [Diamesa tonsa]